MVNKAYHNFISAWNYVRNEIKLFLKILMFYFNMEPRLKWNKIILAAKIIFISFQRWFRVKIKH